jgi:hypothetical protein
MMSYAVLGHRHCCARSVRGRDRYHCTRTDPKFNSACDVLSLAALCSFGITWLRDIHLAQDEKRLNVRMRLYTPSRHHRNMACTEKKHFRGEKFRSEYTTRCFAQSKAPNIFKSKMRKSCKREMSSPSIVGKSKRHEKITSIRDELK